MKCVQVLLAMAVLACLAVPAAAQPITDTFYAAYGEATWQDDRSGGSGDGGGEWYPYTNTGWVSQWFEADGYDPTRRCQVHIEFDARVYDFTNTDGELRLAVNWATDEWSAQGLDRPPLPSDTPDLATEQLYIGRETLFHVPHAASADPIHFATDLQLPAAYNPEWVSVDLMATAWDMGIEVANGVLVHDCKAASGIPEPATLVLLGGALIALRRRRRA